MFRSLHVENFRCFRRFEMTNLGRVNLLVGANNSGKTTLLEALSLLAAEGDEAFLIDLMERRGEISDPGVENLGRPAVFADIRHLFHGARHGAGEAITLRAVSRRGEHSVKLEVASANASADSNGEAPSTNVAVRFCSEFRDGARQSGFSREIVSRPDTGIVAVLRTDFAANAIRPRPPIFVSAFGLDAHATAALFEEVVLTSEEEDVIRALRVIEPGLERLASIQHAGHANRGSRAGMFARLKSRADRVPLGNLGDGMWRLLGVALAIVTSKNSVVLIDEIDAGLHYTVLEKMWRVVDATTRRLDAQLFATTRSRDGYESLAAIARQHVTDKSEVTIQRVEPGRERAVALTEQQIVIAAERGVEVR